MLKTISPCKETTSGCVDSMLFKLWSPRVRWGYKEGLYFYIKIYEEKSLKIFSKNEKKEARWLTQE